MHAKAKPACWARRPQSESSLSAPSIVPRRFVAGIARQFNHERRAFTRLTSNADPAAVIADHRLNDRQTEPRAMRLTRVIRSKEALALFWRESGPGIRDFDVTQSPVLSRTQPERAALRHSIHRIQNEI